MTNQIPRAPGEIAAAYAERCERFDAARARFERAAAELARSNGAVDEQMLDDEEAVIITE